MRLMDLSLTTLLAHSCRQQRHKCKDKRKETTWVLILAQLVDLGASSDVRVPYSYLLFLAVQDKMYKGTYPHACAYACTHTYARTHVQTNLHRLEPHAMQAISVLSKLSICGIYFISVGKKLRVVYDATFLSFAEMLVWIYASILIFVEFVLIL